MKRGLSMVLSLCFLVLLSGISKAEDITDPILKKLVEKGVVTQEDAVGIMKDMDKEKAEKEKKVEEKIDNKVAAAVPVENKDIDFTTPEDFDCFFSVPCFYYDPAFFSELTR